MITKTRQGKHTKRYKISVVFRDFSPRNKRLTIMQYKVINIQTIGSVDPIKT